MKFTIQSLDQPVLNESVVGATASGTILAFNFQPSFVGSVSPGSIFVPLGGERSSYEIAAVVTRSHVTITSQFQNTSLSDSDYLISTSFAPFNNTPYPETSDQQPVEIIKRGLIHLDGLQSSSSGIAALSGSLQGQLDNIPKTMTVERLVKGEDITFFYTTSSRTVQKMIPTIAGPTASGTTWTIRFDSDRQAVGTEVITGGTNTHSGTGGNSGTEITTFDNPDIPATSFVWLETTTASGIISEFSLTLV